MKVTIQQQINELTSIKALLYSAINTACTAHDKPTIPAAQQGNFNYYATHIFANLCSDTPTPTPTTYTVTATSSDTNMGTVSGGGTYNEGTSVTLTASAKTGYRFVSWTKGGTQKSTNASYTFTANSSTAGEYVANFAIKTYSVTATSSDSNMGTVSVNPQTVNHGGSATLTATVTDNNKYRFNGWQKNSTIVSTNNPYTATNITANASFTGVFAEKSGSFKVTISGTGTVSYKVGDGSYKSVTSGKSYSVPINSTITLTARAQSGSTFVGWSGGSTSTDATITFTVTENESKTFTATFQSEQPDRVTVLYHLCAAKNDACGQGDGFTRELVMQNGTLGKMGLYLDYKVSDYNTQEISNMSEFYKLGSFTNAVILLIPKGYEISKANWIDGFSAEQPLTFVPAAQNQGEYGYLFPKGEGDPEYYTYRNNQYTIYIGLWGGLDVNGIKYKIAKTV